MDIPFELWEDFDLRKVPRMQYIYFEEDPTTETLLMQTPYNKEFVEEFKFTVPYEDRNGKLVERRGLKSCAPCALDLCSCVFDKICRCDPVCRG